MRRPYSSRSVVYLSNKNAAQGFSVRHIAQPILGMFFAALVSAAFVISYAAIIYTGPLAYALESGIAFTLLGAAVISSVGALTLSYRGTILGPQDLPAILLASGAAAFAVEVDLPPETLAATVASLIALTSIVTGGLGVVLGKLNLAHIARFFPYPVLAGFLATTGVFLLQGGIDVALGPVEAASWDAYLSPDLMLRWMPAMAVAIFMTLATRLLTGYLVLPVILCTSLLTFYGLYSLLGLDLATLEARGYLLGPFADGGFSGALDITAPMRADWGVILSQAPLILTIAMSALIGTALNASGLELAIKRDFDLNRELKGNGWANVLSGLFGGIPGYHVVGETLLASRLGLNGPSAGLSAAAGCAAFFVLGGSALSNLPVGFFAAIIAFLGIDLLVTWLWVERNRLGALDFATLLVIPSIAVGYGFLTAIAFGLLLACVLFIVEYGRLQIIRVESDLATRRSLVERPDSELSLLTSQGHRAKIVELATYLFFGTSGVLRAKIQERLAEHHTLNWLVMDFKHVPGLDISTKQILLRIYEDCAAQNVTLILTNLPPNWTLDLPETSQGLLEFATLAEGIEHVENALLAKASQLPETIGDRAKDLSLISGLEQFAETVTLAAGEHVLEQEAQSSDIYLLRSGQLRVVARGNDHQAQVIAFIRPGTFVGEMAHYTGKTRSADIIADAPSVLLRVNSETLVQLEASHPRLAAEFHRRVAHDLARRLSRTTALLRAFGA